MKPRALTAVLTDTNHEQDHSGLLVWSSEAHCHLFLNISISSKDIHSAESSLEGISSSDEERRSLFTGGVGTGRSSEWGTGLIEDRRLGYLIFFLEDALKPVILVKQK